MKKKLELVLILSKDQTVTTSNTVMQQHLLHSI